MTLDKMQRGTSMIEILVTLIVVAIGLLGIASMQMVSLKNANTSYQRYVASLYAYDMMERMRSNPAGVQADQYDDLAVDGTESEVTCTNACTPAALAEMDAYEWGQQLRSNLPNGRGTVDEGTDGYEITVTWDEQVTDGSQGAGGGTGADTQTYTLEVAL